MGDSACVMHSFSHAAVMPHDSKQINPMHALGESISFGRFMTESLSWEKWSTFSSHKKYVEEAESYARPGSVAQKKAFFEAHYKRIAAKKAAALLEQENADESEAGDDGGACEEQLFSNSDSAFGEGEEKTAQAMGDKETESHGSLPTDERPLQKSSDDCEEIPSAQSKKSCDLSSMDTWEFPASPLKTENNVTQDTRKYSLDSTGQRRPSSNSLRAVLNLVVLTEHDKKPIIVASAKKTEEISNAKEEQKTKIKKTWKEKAGNKLRKLSCGLYFKPRPSPDFHKECETTKDQIPAAKTQPVVLGRSLSTNKQGTISMPPPPPPPPSVPKKSFSDNSSKKKVPRRSLTHENASPNIQQ